MLAGLSVFLFISFNASNAFLFMMHVVKMQLISREDWHFNNGFLKGRMMFVPDVLKKNVVM